MKKSLFRHATHHIGKRRGAAPHLSVSQPQPEVFWRSIRPIHASRRLLVLKPFLLADIGEGITEVQIIQWFVKPGARVEQFDKLCEVQSDKASVEITSRFDGVIKKLYYEADDMAKVGKPLVDIDIQSEISAEDEALTSPSDEQKGEAESPEPAQAEQKQESSDQSASDDTAKSEPPASRGNTRSDPPSVEQEKQSREASKSGKTAKLATPAVRHLVRQHNVGIEDIPGTGKDGRVLKEDVHRFVEGKKESPPSAQLDPARAATGKADAADETINLSPIQAQMFKTMTRSLSIPHFLYTDTVDLSVLSTLRRSLNSKLPPEQKLSLQPFLIKALSLAATRYPLLNARLDTQSDSSKPQIQLRGAHNFGFAADTPQGLVVPVIRSVQNLSIHSIAAEARRLADLARNGKLSTADLSGGTFTVSNIGSIGGGAVAPVIVEGQVAILGVGRSKVVPAFDADGKVVAQEQCVLSWSADHRVLDGATVARCAEVVKGYLENPGTMLVDMT